LSNEDTAPLEADAEVEQKESAPEDNAAGQQATAEKAPDGAAEQPVQEATLEEQLAAAQRRAQENLDGWQRTLAEFQNYRKRVERDLKDSYQRASLDMVLKLLPIVDDLERGMAGVPEELRGDAWLEGIELIQRKFLKLLDDLDRRHRPGGRS
jgi:molecular chaperone GrpE